MERSQVLDADGPLHDAADISPLQAAGQRSQPIAEIVAREPPQPKKLNKTKELNVERFACL